MKHILITTIAAVLVVGCATTQSPEPPTGKAPDISIHDAAREGNIEAVKQHLAAGADVDAKDDIDKSTPLLYAAMDGQKEVAELLIAKGADVNAKDEDGGTPLDYANDVVADVLRKHGGKHGTIHSAVEGGDIEAVKEFLAAGADVNAKGMTGWTALHYAALDGHKEVVELLIAAGADVNAKDIDGDTPLDFSIGYSHTETIALLRKHGGKTGEELKAAGKPTEPVAEAAKPEPPSAKAPYISIQDAVFTENIEAVKQHIAAGTDVNAKSSRNGSTPLAYAAYKGRKEIVELLIAAGADVNAKVASGPKQGLTPLDAANETNHTETADLLRKHGGKTGEELKAE